MEPSSGRCGPFSLLQGPSGPFSWKSLWKWTAHGELTDTRLLPPPTPNSSSETPPFIVTPSLSENAPVVGCRRSDRVPLLSGVSIPKHRRLLQNEISHGTAKVWILHFGCEAAIFFSFYLIVHIREGKSDPLPRPQRTTNNPAIASLTPQVSPSVLMRTISWNFHRARMGLPWSHPWPHNPVVWGTL